MALCSSIALDGQPLIAAATVAAQATSEEGFRQRDVRFFSDLFSNWIQSTTGQWAMDLHNTQVMRYLNALVAAGFARRAGRKPPRYALTPAGLVELLTRMTERTSLRAMDEFLLVFHILQTYGDRLRGMLERNRDYSSRMLALDMNRLLDAKEYVRRERKMIDRERKRLAARSDESMQTRALSNELLKSGSSLDAVVQEVEERFPYELNSERPLSELLSSLPAPWRRFEIEEAASSRAMQLWDPTRELLEAYDAILARLTSS